MEGDLRYLAFVHHLIHMFTDKEEGLSYEQVVKAAKEARRRIESFPVATESGGAVIDLRKDSVGRYL